MRPTIAAYYFPNWHVDEQNAAWHGAGWTEWELTRAARPRFPGHRQPIVPAWGCFDEADPAWMAKQIDAAADHGVDVFLFDWYWHDGGPVLHRALDEGFLRAPNRDRVRFACMWANHDWIDIHPARLGGDYKLRWAGVITPATWEKLTDRLVALMKHPNHWRVDGMPYFSVYELYRLVQSFGSVDACRAALDRLVAKARAAGLPGVHLAGVVWGVQLLPGETAVKDPAELVARLGLHSVTSYVWIHHQHLEHFPATPYPGIAAGAVRTWDELAGRFGVPYHPNVTVGWDASPRCHADDPFENRGYPFMATLGGNTPEAFAASLRDARTWCEAHRSPVLTVNAWNEWTEGSYLLPDTDTGMARLEAIRAVFGRADAPLAAGHRA